MWKRGLVFAVGVVVVGAALWALRPAPVEPPAPIEVGAAILAFPGATDWSETACTDVAAGDVCRGQWRHQTGQIARVLLLPLPDPSKLETLAARLQAQATAAGGVAEVFDTGTGRVIRLLQPMRDADHEDRVLVGISYVVTAPDKLALHLLMSTVPLSEEEAGDQRVRDLLAFGAWIDEGGGPGQP